MLIREAAPLRYQQIYLLLRQQIEAQELLPQTRVPPDRELVTQFQASRLTISKAVSQLVEEGYLVRRPGSGTFVTDLAARQHRLRAGVQHVALLVPYSHDRFTSALIKAISDALYEHDCSLHFYDSDGHGAREAQFLKRVIAHKEIQGVIAFPISMEENHDLYLETLSSGRPVVFVDRYFPDFEADSVSSDNVAGAHLAVRQLIAQGHRVVAHLYPEEGRNTAQIDRRLGYERALLQAGLPCSPALMRQADRLEPTVQTLRSNHPTNSCVGVLDEWFALPEPPTAIFCGNDFVLQSCILTLRGMGRRVPEEIALAGFCDMDDWLPHVDEPFVGIRQQTAEIGCQAVRLLLDRIQSAGEQPSSPLNPQSVLVRPRLWFHGPEPETSSLAPRPKENANATHA